MNEIDTTQETGISKSKNAIIEEAQRIEENCSLTAKAHFEAARVWGSCDLSTGVVVAILAAIAGALALAQFDPQELFNVIIGITSIVVAVLAGVSAFLRPNEKALTHHQAGTNFDSLLTRTRMFRSIECWQVESEEILTKKLETLSEERSRLNSTSRQPPRWAYKRAKKGIDAGEASYAVDNKRANANGGEKQKLPPAAPPAQ